MGNKFKLMGNVFAKKFAYLVFSLEFFVLNSKTWKLALKSRDHRHLTADRYQCKTSKQFFKINTGNH